MFSLAHTATWRNLEGEKSSAASLMMRCVIDASQTRTAPQCRHIIAYRFVSASVGLFVPSPTSAAPRDRFSRGG